MAKNRPNCSGGFIGEAEGCLKAGECALTCSSVVTGPDTNNTTQPVTSSNPGHEYTMGGIKVKFPFKAYPPQLSIMAKIIRALHRSENALLESPTGTGKSLALLCSALAWQQNANNMASPQKPDTCPQYSLCNCSCHMQAKPNSDTKMDSKLSEGMPTIQDDPTERSFPTTPNKMAPPLRKQDLDTGTKSNETDIGFNKRCRDDFEDDDFKPAPKKLNPTKKKKGVIFDEDMPDFGEGIVSVDHPRETTIPRCLLCRCKDGKIPELKRQSVPKIFFGSRTHKQLKQLPRELNRTQYKHVVMSVLSSRNYTCVHPDVSRNINKNEGCKELRDGKYGKTCLYYHHRIRSYSDLASFGITEAWDIEDLVHAAKRKMVCPYYTARYLAKEASIVFCPYNYLIDPIIRKTLELSLNNQIVILDEGHNIENSSREASSYSVELDQLQIAVDDLGNGSVNSFQLKDEHQKLHIFALRIFDWLDNSSAELVQRSYNEYSKVLSGPDMVQVLEENGITPETLKVYTQCLAHIMDHEVSDGEVNVESSLLASSVTVLEGLFMVIGYMFKDELKFAPDYRIAVVKKITQQTTFITHGKWHKKRQAHDPAAYKLTLNFWCMNPAVAFSELANMCKSVILTSGTLSPLNTFASELGVQFPIQLEANHVINSNQLWAGTIGCGPTGETLLATYKHTQMYLFQDELGRVVLGICKAVPYGVLCFLPSYKMLDKLSTRWKDTGLWAELLNIKHITCEPRGENSKQMFDESLKQFYENVDNTEYGQTGALFFAVCRGKISEGLDFSDNNARAVITVGIPFPNFKDLNVDLKKEYNSKLCVSKKLLSGSEWYETQAYRALNQALGRCIRHKTDWGALIMVDERFGIAPAKYLKGISKWVRKNVRHYQTFDVAMTSLQDFTSEQINSNDEPTTSPRTAALNETVDKSATASSSSDPMSAFSGSEGAGWNVATAQSLTGVRQSHSSGHNDMSAKNNGTIDYRDVQVMLPLHL